MNARKESIVKRALVLALPLVVAIGACSGDDEDEPADTAAATAPDETKPADPEPETDDSVTLPTLPDISLPDISLPDVSIPDLDELEDQLRDTLGQTGLTDEQIDCLIERAEEVGSDATDLNDIMDLFGDCDIDLADLQPGG